MKKILAIAVIFALIAIAVSVPEVSAKTKKNYPCIITPDNDYCGWTDFTIGPTNVCVVGLPPDYNSELDCCNYCTGRNPVGIDDKYGTLCCQPP